LQEGDFAQKLWFQFKDGPVDLAQAFAELDKLTQSDIRYVGLKWDIEKQIQPMRRFLHIDSAIPMNSLEKHEGVPLLHEGSPIEGLGVQL
jgi:hypothetical protein